MCITAAVLAEICSALPLSGSIYIWAAESAGPDYARFFGFIVAWWSSTAWMTFAAGNCQVRASQSYSFKLSNPLDSPRPLPTISSLNCPSGRSTSQEGHAMIMSSGVPSFGSSPREFWCWPLPSITSPRECTRSCLSSPLGCFSSTSSCALSGFLSGCRDHTDSVLQKRYSLQHVSISFQSPPGPVMT